MEYTTLDSSGFATSNGWITVHNYSPETGEYINSEDVYMTVGVGIPAQATLSTLPKEKKGFTRALVNGAWSQVEDHRGELWYDKKTADIVPITTIGKVDTSKYTQEKPVIVIPIQDRAAMALADARIYVTNNYTILNEPTPNEWVIYIKALMAITNGTDTTSTELPTAP